MPAEFRQILFSNNELIEALYEYNEAAEVKLPQGVIVSCTPVAEAKVAVRLELVDKVSGETQVASLAPEMVAAALLRYCIQRRIPMPKGATKSIQAHGAEISLDVRIEGRTKQSRPASGSAGAAAPEE